MMMVQLQFILNDFETQNRTLCSVKLAIYSKVPERANTSSKFIYWAAYKRDIPYFMFFISYKMHDTEEVFLDVCPFPAANFKQSDENFCQIFPIMSKIWPEL